MAFKRVPVAAASGARALANAQAIAHGIPKWMAPRSRVELVALMEAGASVALRHATGDVDHVVVGVVRRMGLRVVIRPWGASGELAVPLGAVSGVTAVPEHSYDVEAEIRRRQRRGEPALVLPRRKRGATQNGDP